MRGIRFQLPGFTLFIMFAVLAALPGGDANAETRYVSDTLIVTLREGPGAGYKVVRTVRTNTPLEVLEENERYVKVRTKDGDEGWVSTQYVSTEIPKPFIIAKLQREIAKQQGLAEDLKKKLVDMQGALDTAKNRHSETVKELKTTLQGSKKNISETESELTRMTTQYNTLLSHSKNVVDLVKERDNLLDIKGKLKKQNDRLQQEFKEIKKANAQLVSKRLIWWFLAGGGLLFVGLMTGKVSRKKKYY